MANKQSEFERIRKDFGVQSPPNYTKRQTRPSDSGKQSNSASSSSNQGNTQATSFDTQLKNAYTNAKNKTNTKTTITSKLTDDERNARIKEIDTEVRDLNIQLSGYGWAKAYGASKAMEEAEQKVKDSIDKLVQEKKNLERVGTFTASEMLQWEIDDANSKKAALPKYSPAARVAPSGVEAFQKNVNAHYALDKEINELERQKQLYDDISKFGDIVNEDNASGQRKANYRNTDLSRKAADAANEYIRNPTEENREIALAYKAFTNEYAKNNEKALDDENVKASWINKYLAGYLPQLKDRIIPQLVGGGIGFALGSLVGAPNAGLGIGTGLASYAQSFDDIRGSVFLELLSMGLDEETALKLAEDEAIKSAAIEGVETGVGWGLAGIGGLKNAIGNAAKASVTKGSTNAVTKLAANMASKATNKAVTKAAKAATRPLWKTAIKTVGGVAKEPVTEYLEEFSQGAVSVATREKAMAILDNAIGQYGVGNINLYDRPIYENDDGTISTVDSVTFQIDDKYVLLPTIIRDENGNAKRLSTDEEVFAHYKKTREYLGEFDTQEEAYAYANKLHHAQAYHYSPKSTNADDGLMSGAVKVVSDAISGQRPDIFEELHEQGKGGAITSLMLEGARTTATNIVTQYFNRKTVKLQNEFADDIIKDEEALNALVESGKESGEGTVSAKLAEEVEQAKQKGNVTREQVKRLIQSNEVYKKAEQQTSPPTSLEEAARGAVQNRQKKSPVQMYDALKRGEMTAEILDALSKDNVQITAEEVKKVTGLGDKGSELIAKLANRDGVTFSQAEQAVKTAYMAGHTDISSIKVNFENNLQKAAFDAGKIDRGEQDRLAIKNAQNAAVYDGAFTENEYTKDYNDSEKKMISTFAKGLRMDVKAVDEIIASTTIENGTEVKHYANASHVNGQMEISSGARNILYKMVLHEGGHRMRQLAPTEFGVLIDALHDRAVRRSVKDGLSPNYAFDKMKETHDKAGISLNTSGYLEEMAVRELETIFSSAEEFNAWYDEISGNQQAKNAWEKFVDWFLKVVADIKQSLDLAKMSKTERAEAKRTIAELDRIKEHLANTIKAAEKSATTLAESKNKAVAKENVSSEESLSPKGKNDADVKFSIKEGLHTDLADVFNGVKKNGRSELLIGTTSDFLVNTLKADPLMVTMPMSKAYAAMATEEEAKRSGRYNSRLNYHGLGVDLLYESLVASENPVAAFVAENEVDEKTGETIDRSDRIVLVTDKVKDRKNVVVIMEVDTTGTVEGNQISVNKDISVYDRKSILSDISRAVADDRLLHYDKKRSHTISAGKPASNSLGTIQKVDFNANITQFWNNVKWIRAGKPTFFETATDSNDSAFAEALKKAVQKNKGNFSLKDSEGKNGTQAKIPSVKVGDVYEMNGTTYTITDRNDTHTTYKVAYSSGHTSTSQDTNPAVDMMFEGKAQKGISFSLKDLGYEDKTFDFDVTQSDINQYIEKAYQNENKKSYIKFLKVGSDLIEEVSSDFDITGYSHALRDNDIRHIKNSHGKKTNEKYPVTEADIELIPFIVENHDKVFYKTNANGDPGLTYVKVMPGDVIYYVEAITTEYNGEKLLVNKQMIKTGIDSIPNLYGLVDAINKKQSSSQYLADLQKIREAYVQDVKENYSTKNISQDPQFVKGENSTTTQDNETKALDNVGVQSDSKSKSVAPSFSLQTWTESQYVQDTETAVKAIMKATGVTEADARRYIKNINSIARLIADDRARLDYDSNIDENASVLKSNKEYKWTVDMSTLCAKRLLFTGTFDAIQRAMPNTAFNSEDIVSLRSMMMERGYEVACGICYVESTRRELGTITADFIERYKLAQKNGVPISKINSAGKEVILREKGTNRNFYTEKGYVPTLAELNTTDIDLVKRDHPKVYAAYLAFMKSRGQAIPKLLETRTEYKGEILKHFNSKSAVKSRNDAGGLRVQSFSDFEVAHLIDMMQIVLDMSQAGLMSQAYTKVPAFADVFGNTGMKINLSLIAKGSGLDANGNLIFDDVEGIPHEEAFRLRDKYSKNVGTILVGKNNAHIRAALVDPRIDFVIPFHKSFWKESLYDALGLTGYKDYTDTQNEKPLDKDRKIKNFQPSEYWDYSKSGEENAQTYLDMCAKDGRTPKFPQFIGCEGYWKLLIDFKMYDNEGVGSPQMVVKPEFAMDEATAIMNAYEGGHRQFPVAQDVVDDFVEQYKNKSASFSLQGGASISELLDAIEGVQKGGKNATSKLYKYVEGGMITTEEYDKLIEKYGAIHTGEKPYRDVQVPRKSGKNKKVSQTVRTILEAEVTPDEAIPTIEKMVEDGVFSYEAYEDKEAISHAEAYIEKRGWAAALTDWFNAVESGRVSKDLTATGWALYNNAANTAATTASETERKTAVQTSLMLLDGMVKHQRSAAQALQATRILKSLSPEAQLYGIQKSVQALQNELTDKYGKKTPTLKIDEELAEEFLAAETEDERLSTEIEIYKDIGSQLPSDWLDMWNAWRYVAMLSSLRTHGKNILGNAFFAPVVLAKDLTAAAIESVVNRVSTKKMIRGKALITGNKEDRQLLKAAWDDYSNVADIVSNGGKYSDSATGHKYIEDGRTVFRGVFKPIEPVRKANSRLLELEDMWFSKPHYAYALAQYCKANNITADQIKRGKAIAPAREYAIKEAQKATYKDTNAFSQFVSGLGRNGKSRNWAEKSARVVVEGILPFRKTPANILARGVEYSPIGLLKGLTYDLFKVSRGELSATEAIDNISAGLTGTGLLALGVYLAAQGLIRGHGEDEKKEKEFSELMGHQSYSLELPNGASVTLDWLAPEALPFFVGVNIWEATRKTKDDVNLAAILSALSSISDPMLEMSFLQGLNDALESVGYAESNHLDPFPVVLSSAITSYISQAIPTLFGQIERTGEENRMTTHIEKNDFLTSGVQRALGKASAKIPFWDYNQIPYIDAWGRKEASGTALKRGLNNFLNPAYTSTVETSDMEKELLRLYESTGDGGVFPKRADEYFTVDGVRKDLTADEYVRYATLKGEKSYKLVSELVHGEAYKKLSNTEKAKAISEVYDYANQKAKQAISNYTPDAWVHKADEFGSNVGNYISFKTEVSGAKEENGGKISRQEVADIVLDMAQNDFEAWEMYLSMYESEGVKYARDNGVDGEVYMHFIESLNEYDQPTKNGTYGTYTQAEVKKAINSLNGLSRKEKNALYKSVNTKWKNPY